jgi:pyruvate,water dikinase
MMPAVYVNLSVPGRAAEAVELGVDGVGLMRAEFLVFQTGQHPLLLLEAQPPGDLTSVIAEGVRTVARELYPRPLTYRSLDLRSNDLRNLAGGDRFEADEDNPALGCRGVSRSQRDVGVFGAELAALATLHGEGFDNLRLMLPFVRWPEEVTWAREQLATAGLGEGSGLELWMMVETPATILRAAEFAPLVDGVSIGSNDLTQLLLGIDRDNVAFADRSFDLDPTVIEGLRLAVDAYRAFGVPVGICGDAPSRSEELLQLLVTWGLTSVSVSLDRVAALQRLVAQVGEPTGVGRKHDGPGHSSTESRLSR